LACLVAFIVVRFKVASLLYVQAFVICVIGGFLGVIVAAYINADFLVSGWIGYFEIAGFFLVTIASCCHWAITFSVLPREATVTVITMQTCVIAGLITICCLSQTIYVQV